MSYTMKYKQDMERYKELLATYTAITDSKQYREIYDTMPFEFLNAKQKAETLELCKDIGKDSVFKFTRADDAISFYNSVCDLKRNIDTLLESASCIVEASKVAEEMNELVEDSVYLPNNLKIDAHSRVTEMAKECLAVLPGYPNLMTKSFLHSFIESCIDCLDKDGLAKMVEFKIIKPAVLNEIRLFGSDHYKENISHLQVLMNVPKILSEHHLVRLTGTTFKNEDGSDRQEILASLKEAEKPVDIKCVPTMYTPEVGTPENAVEVHWKESCLGYVPRDVVGQMYHKYKNPQFEGEFKQVVGGGSVKYGCEIDLGIVAAEYLKEDSKEKEASGSEKEAAVAEKE